MRNTLLNTYEENIIEIRKKRNSWKSVVLIENQYLFSKYHRLMNLSFILPNKHSIPIDYIYYNVSNDLLIGISLYINHMIIIYDITYISTIYPPSYINVKYCFWYYIEEINGFVVLPWITELFMECHNQKHNLQSFIACENS